MLYGRKRPAPAEIFITRSEIVRSKPKQRPASWPCSAAARISSARASPPARQRWLHRGEEGHVPIAQHRSRSEEHTSELQSLMRISYAVFCLKKKNKILYFYHINECL